MAHELIYSLAGGVPAPVVAAGEPLTFRLDPPPPPGTKDLPVETPGGERTRAIVISGDGEAHARLDDATEAGVYRLTLPDPPGGSAYAAVAGDDHESDMTPLDPSEAASLAQGWPLDFAASPESLEASLSAPAPSGKHEVWRVLVLAALAVLCVEVFLTRRIVRSQGLSG